MKFRINGDEKEMIVGINKIGAKRLPLLLSQKFPSKADGNLLVVYNVFKTFINCSILILL